MLPEVVILVNQSIKDVKDAILPYSFISLVISLLASHIQFHTPHHHKHQMLRTSGDCIILLVHHPYSDCRLVIDIVLEIIIRMEIDAKVEYNVVKEIFYLFNACDMRRLCVLSHHN